MSERKQIRNYLNNLSRYLSPLQDIEAQEVVKEIESHIYDVIDDVEVKGGVADVEAILDRFGPPRELAQQYIGHIQQGTPPPEGFKAISIVKKGLSRTVYLGLMCFGYFIGIACIALGFANLLLPGSIGIWSEANGNTVVIGMLDNPVLVQETVGVVQGLWLSPVALILGYLILLMTHKVLKFVRQFSIGQHYV
ncbi:HAAS signaling domain-containing protein [Alteromonas antoniana]|uniref:HAAS signaling domain-containing protein n=1 Tax=Alteromonas antoniana TaxID=2803813 RepID=UPI001C4799E0|nr:hypothetical protein [Alteromonas antoniana]